MPIFQHCDTRTIILLVQRMKSAIYCPGEFVVRQATYGKALFLINRGIVHVLISSAENQAAAAAAGGGSGDAAASYKPRVVATLTDSEFFGENALVSATQTNASVRCVTYSDMSVLLRSDFQEVVAMCPDLARSVEAAAAELKAKRERDLNRQQSRISLSPAKQRLSTLRSSRSSADLASRRSAERPQSPSRGRDTDGDDDAGPLVVDPSDPAALAAGTPPASTRSSTRGSTSQTALTKSLFGNRKGSKRKDSEGSRRGGLSGSVRSTARVRPSSVEADPDDPDGGGIVLPRISHVAEPVRDSTLDDDDDDGSFKNGDGEEGDTGARDDSRDRDSILDPGARDETRRRSVGFRVDDVDT